MSELMQIIKSRRSTRAFRSELPPKEQILKLTEAAEWAPSGMGKFLLHFTVVYSAEKSLKLARAVAGDTGAGHVRQTQKRPHDGVVLHPADQNMVTRMQKAADCLIERHCRACSEDDAGRVVQSEQARAKQAS